MVAASAEPALKYDDKRFHVRVELRDDRGHWRVRWWWTGLAYHYEPHATEVSARAAATRLVAMHAEQSPLIVQAPRTLAELVGRLERREDLTSKTRSVYRRVLAPFLLYVGGDRDLHSLGRRDVDGWLGSLEVTPTSKATYLRTLRAVFRWAVREHFVEHECTQGARVVARQVMRAWLDARHWGAMLEACDERHRVRAAFALETGLRAGELAAARWSWLRWTAGRPAIEVAIDRDTGFVPKWGHERIIPLSLAAQDCLEAARALWPRTDHIFFDVVPRELKLAKPTRAACARAGVPSVDFHGLRRSCGARWLELGFELIEVSRLLGHRDISTTARWYAGIAPSHLALRFQLVDTAGASRKSGIREALTSPDAGCGRPVDKSVDILWTNCGQPELSTGSHRSVHSRPQDIHRLSTGRPEFPVGAKCL